MSEFDGIPEPDYLGLKTGLRRTQSQPQGLFHMPGTKKARGGGFDIFGLMRGMQGAAGGGDLRDIAERSAVLSAEIAALEGRQGIAGYTGGAGASPGELAGPPEQVEGPPTQRGLNPMRFPVADPGTGEVPSDSSAVTPPRPMAFHTPIDRTVSDAVAKDMTAHNRPNFLNKIVHTDADRNAIAAGLYRNFLQERQREELQWGDQHPAEMAQMRAAQGTMFNKGQKAYINGKWVGPPEEEPIHDFAKPIAVGPYAASSSRGGQPILMQAPSDMVMHPGHEVPTAPEMTPKYTQPDVEIEGTMPTEPGGEIVEPTDPKATIARQYQGPPAPPTGYKKGDRLLAEDVVSPAHTLAPHYVQGRTKGGTLGYVTADPTAKGIQDTGLMPAPTADQRDVYSIQRNERGELIRVNTHTTGPATPIVGPDGKPVRPMVNPNQLAMARKRTKDFLTRTDANTGRVISEPSPAEVDQYLRTVEGYPVSEDETANSTPPSDRPQALPPVSAPPAEAPPAVAATPAPGRTPPPGATNKFRAIPAPSAPGGWRFEPVE